MKVYIDSELIKPIVPVLRIAAVQTWAMNAERGPSEHTARRHVYTRHRSIVLREQPAGVAFGSYFEAALVSAGDRARAKKVEDTDPGDLIAKVSATIFVVYKVKPDFSRPENWMEMLEEFARTNVIFNSWPYWREILGSCVSRLGLLPVVLDPLLVLPRVRPAAAVDSSPSPADADGSSEQTSTETTGATAQADTTTTE